MRKQKGPPTVCQRKTDRLWAAHSLFGTLESSKRVEYQKLPKPANLHLWHVIFILRSLILEAPSYCSGFLSVFLFIGKNPAPKCGIFACIFFVNATWCRWGDSNPHGVATGGFWVRYVYQFHHTGELSTSIPHTPQECKRNIDKIQQKLGQISGNMHILIIVLYKCIPSRIRANPRIFDTNGKNCN